MQIKIKCLQKMKKYEPLLIAVIALLYVFLLLWFTGTLTSGYHLQDDHEICCIMKDLWKADMPGRLFFRKDCCPILRAGYVSDQYIIH